MLFPSPSTTTRLSNLTCPYCGVDLSSSSRTKEHAIGRNFVPKGSLADSWNLLLNACRSCNARKSALENDISAISMMPNTDGSFPLSDQKYQSESIRKSSGSISHASGKPVAQSRTEMKIKGVHPAGLEMTLNMVGAPQVSEERVSTLARLQLMAFFYWLTYDAEERKGHFWVGDFFLANHTRQEDFGNILQVSFANCIRDWDHRLLAIAANGNFKAVIRRAPTGIFWAWGLEWNHSMRAIGYFGNKDDIKVHAANLQYPELKSVGKSSNGGIIRVRTEHRIKEEDDLLFEGTAT